VLPEVRQLRDFLTEWKVRSSAAGEAFWGCAFRDEGAQRFTSSIRARKPDFQNPFTRPLHTRRTRAEGLCSPNASPGLCQSRFRKGYRLFRGASTARFLRPKPDLCCRSKQFYCRAHPASKDCGCGCVVQRRKRLRIVTVGISGGGSLTRPFRAARRFLLSSRGVVRL
jgi:hypothetical protein